MSELHQIFGVQTLEDLLRLERAIGEAVWRFEEGNSSEEYQYLSSDDRLDYECDAGRRILSAVVGAGYVVVKR